MLKNIVIDCSPLTNTLRVGRVGKARTRLLEWEEREDEILNAVRDHLLALAEEGGKKTAAYEWTRADGKVVELRLTIKDGADNAANPDDLREKGRWLPTNDNNKKRCSRCDVIHLIAQYPHGQTNYCPNCGAKMDGKENEDA